MKRKINRVGQTTLTVSLPSKWVRQNNIKKGDEIDVEEEGTKLILAPNLHPIKKEAIITIPNPESYLERFICGPYVKGYDKIIVKYKDKEIYNRVLKTSKLLMGFEIIDEGEGYCTLANISSQLEENFGVLMNRLFMDSISFGKEFVEKLKSSEKEDLDILLEYEFNANRIALFCRRIIQKGGIDHKVYSTFSLYSVIAHVEESIDLFREIIRMLGDSRPKLDKSTLELFEKAVKMQNIQYEIFANLVKGKTVMDLIDLFRQHKDLRRSVWHNLDYFKGDKINSYICGKLIAMVELSHHISEELFY